MIQIDRRTLLATLPAAALLPSAWQAQAAVGPSHALSLYGDVKYGPDFTHFSYVDPEAPKGGTVKVSAVGTFDNLNPFILKGTSFIRVANDFMQTGALFDSLMVGSGDEPSTAYGLIAESVELPEDRLSVTLTLRPEARFHDGSPITPDDVVWTFDTLMAKGSPVYRIALADVARAEKLDERRVRFVFKSNTDRQLPLTVAALPVLPAAWWRGKEFDRPTLEPLLGSAGYRMARIDPGRSIVWERVADYWAADLPVNKGTGNFDIIQCDYYRDATVLREAFKAGLIDIREDATAADWQNAYNFPAVQRGLVIKDEVPHDVPRGMQSFVFNTRRPLFQDPRVRRALGFALDFNWYNKTYFYDTYKQINSYWNNSELGSKGLPEGAELALLERYRGRIPETVFSEVYTPPLYPDETAFRNGLRQALTMLKAAGWSTRGQRLVNDATGQPFEFEFMNDEPRLERAILPWLQNLERLGIKGTIRSVDDAQSDLRMREYDFDVLTVNRPASLVPGTELRAYYASASAATPGTPNLAGIADPVVDELVELVIGAETRDELMTRVRALDRILLRGYYGVPCWYADTYRVAYWAKFAKPAIAPKYADRPASVFGTWWIDAAKEPVLAQQQRELGSQ